MVVKICPRCNQAYVVEAHEIDILHECKTGNTTLDEEDVVVVGSWEDYTGSDSIAKGNVPFQGSANKLWGTRAQIEGEDVETLTRRGKRQSTHRQRQHVSYINFGGMAGDCNKR